MTKYVVSQTFEGLGDPCRETFTSRTEAGEAADTFRRFIAEMVAGQETPWERPGRLTKTGDAGEIAAWESALEIAGVEYDEYSDERTDDSPETYGKAAGEMIANAAVEIEEETEEE